MAVVLAMASALRYYFVITIGERIVSDLRRDVFNHVIRLSPSFFDVNQSGEIVSRLTADTTQIKSAVGATASLALRNTILCLGAVGMMIVTSPKLSAMVLATIPLIVFPLVAFGRSVRARSRAAQDTLASASAFAGETIAATRTVQAFTGEDAANARYSSAVEEAYEAARSAIKSRSFLTGCAIALVFGSVVGVLWYGAHSVLDGSLSAGTLGQFLLYSRHRRRLARRTVGSLGRTLPRPAARRNACPSSCMKRPQSGRQLTLPPCPPARPAVSTFDDVHFAYPSRPTRETALGPELQGRSGRNRRHRRSFWRRQEHRLLAGAAVLRPRQRQRLLRRQGHPHRRARCASPAHRHRATGRHDLFRQHRG